MSNWRPEPPPQNELERLMRKAADDPGQHGKMFRLLWEAELFLFAPDHPEMRGEYALQNGDQITFLTFQHAQGPYALVCTSEAAADYLGEQAPEPKPAMMGMPGEVRRDERIGRRDGAAPGRLRR